MSGVESITAAPAIDAVAIQPDVGAAQPQTSSVSFAEMINRGITETETKVREANDLTRQFVENPSEMAVHEVIMALEEARLAVDLALQIRTRVIEGYREIMNMQL